ncbi:hypothetical protein D3C72_2474440 [compost metagenome]
MNLCLEPRTDEIDVLRPDMGRDDKAIGARQEIDERFTRADHPADRVDAQVHDRSTFGSTDIGS